jgi:RHS repeat-associated protein
LQSTVSALEQTAAETVVQINSDTLISENNRQFEGRTIQVNGRVLTVDGTHTFANLVLLNGAVLTHSPTTATKVNKLDITVTGTIQIDASSKIDVSGRGFLGGSAPGNPFGARGMTFAFQAGSSGASGGSFGGLGGGTANGIYGNFRDPSDVGSGGGTGSSFAGGNGGGLSRIIVQTLNLDGSILANGDGGGCCDAGGGSGGGIRIDVGTLRGNGQIRANGQDGKGRVNIGGGAGGGGRVAVYYQTVSGFDFTKISAFGGSGAGGLPNGAAGTVYLQGPATAVGELVVDNNNIPASATTLIPVTGGQLSLTNLSLRGGRLSIDDRVNLGGTLAVSASGELTLKDSVVAVAVTISGNSAVLPLPSTSSAVFKLDLTTTTLSIDNTSRIDVSGRGFLGGKQPGNPFDTRGMTVGFQAGSTGPSGGGYAGLGGGSSNGVYGDFRNPNDAGSGGGAASDSLGGNGGGLIRIIAQTLNLDGAILANGSGGGTADAGGGSGGAIRIDVGTLSGTGQVRANGQDGKPRVNIGGGGGGGGRVAIYYQIVSGFDLAKISAFGGTGNGGQPNGGSGTVYLQGPAREAGELIIDNNNLAVSSLTTPIPNPASGGIALTHLRLRRQARVRFDSLLTLTGALELTFNAELVSTQRVVAGTIGVTNNSLITHLPATATASFKVDISAGMFTIDATSKIDVSGRGFLGGRQPGNPFIGRGMTFGFQAGSSGDAGGSYGGLGGGPSNSLYGNLVDPNEPGSGGGASAGPAGNGGGLIRIAAQTLTLNGSILANGEGGGCCDAGGGSGGGIRIDVGSLTGTGQIRANGQDGKDRANFGGGGGGGGRIAVYFQNMTGFNAASISALGGLGKGGQPNGQNGTVQLQQQIAMLAPALEEVPVMQAESYGGSAVRIALADIPQHLPLESSGELEIEKPESVIYENRYAMFSFLASGTSVSTNPNLKSCPELCQGIENPKFADSSVFPNPESKIANPKLDDLDPIYTYDLNGNRTSMIDPTGLTTYSYDALNRLTSMTNNKGQTTTFSYDALGRRTTMTHANGVVTNYTYDAASQLLSIAHQLGATTLNSFSYSYDKAGNRNSKADNNGTANYTYDALNRLIQVINPLPSNPLESFNYDAVGNRISSNQNGASTFNQANQLLEDASFTYQYDDNGNMTRKTAKVGGLVTTYEYDAENKLVRVVTPTKTVNYKYDGLGRRVEKEVIDTGTTMTRYVYDNEDILLELNGANTIVARYSHGPGIDEPLIMEKNGQSFYYHADGLGSVTEITNQSGAVVQRYAYSSFGKIESQLDPNFVQPYTFTARELDSETALYSYRARAYDFSNGRFLQEDPIKQFGGSINFYPYVLNNPPNLADPSGNIVQLLTPDTYLDLGFLGYDFYRILVDNVLNDCDNLGTNLGSFAGNLAGLAIPGVTGLGAGFRGAKSGKLVIGKMEDLERTTLESGEFILDWLNKGSSKANWQENSKLMREIMSESRSIRDVSVDPLTGELLKKSGFIAAERNLLKNQGWTYNPQTRHWYAGK